MRRRWRSLRRNKWFVRGVAAVAPLVGWYYTSDSAQWTAIDHVVTARSLLRWDGDGVSGRAAVTRQLASGRSVNLAGADNPVQLYRQRLQVKFPTPAWASSDYVDLDKVGSWEVSVKLDFRSGDQDPIYLLYVHGGRLVAGDARIYANLLAGWSLALDAVVSVVDYPTAPEAAPALIAEDLGSAYLAAARKQGERRVVVAADGAGAAVAITALNALRKAGYAMPAGLVLLSPSTDLLDEGAAASDRLITQRTWRILREHAATEDELRAVSPLQAENQRSLAGLPPTLVVWDQDDLAAPQARRLATSLRDSKVPVETLERRGLWPNWLFIYHLFPEGREDMNRVRQFVDAVSHRPAASELPAVPPHPAVRAIRRALERRGSAQGESGRAGGDGR